MFAPHVNPYSHLSLRNSKKAAKDDCNSAKYQNNWTTQNGPRSSKLLIPFGLRLGRYCSGLGLWQSAHIELLHRGQTLGLRSGLPSTLCLELPNQAPARSIYFCYSPRVSQSKTLRKLQMLITSVVFYGLMKSSKRSPRTQAAQPVDSGGNLRRNILRAAGIKSRKEARLHRAWNQPKSMSSSK